MTKSRQIAILFSGGTDSTAATALLAEQYDRVHLLSYFHSGSAQPKNAATNIPKLVELYGDKFEHHIFSTDKLFRHFTYERYFKNLRRYGLFNLTSCGFCKLAMHVRTLVYCLDHDIIEVADGANRHMSHFPAQMKAMLDPLRELYAHFHISFENPVFEYENPREIDWIHKLGLADLAQSSSKKKLAEKEEAAEVSAKTTGDLLLERGILSNANVKGTATDRKMQARCFQLTLLNAFALGYFIPTKGMDAYQQGISRFYTEKISVAEELLQDYRERGNESRLAGLVERNDLGEHDAS